MATYEPFVISIDQQPNGAYRVSAEFQGVERHGESPADLPLLEPREIERAGIWLEEAVIDSVYARDLGSRLFHTLLPPPVLAMFREAYQRLGPRERLRVVLNLPLPEPLAGLPWVNSARHS